MYCILQRLLSHTQTELQNTWSAVQERSAERRLWIDNTTKMLNTIEDERTNRVSIILTVTYYTQVVSVCNVGTIPVVRFCDIFFNTLFGSLNHFGQNFLHLVPNQKWWISHIMRFGLD